MPAFASDAPPSNTLLQSEPAEHQFLLESSRAIARGVLLGQTKVRLKPLLLELYPSSSDELVNGPFGAALSGRHHRAFRFDKIESPGV